MVTDTDNLIAAATADDDAPTPADAPVTGATTAAAARRTRNTQQRRAVLSAVRALVGKHPTAADVFAEVRRDHPQMSLATVYRALHALVEQHEVMEMRVENVARYDAGPCAHHHVVCRRCGCVVDICCDLLPPAALRQLGRALERASAFRLDIHPIQFSGLCPSCSRPHAPSRS